MFFKLEGREHNISNAPTSKGSVFINVEAMLATVHIKCMIQIRVCIVPIKTMYWFGLM
jgi:hypothetical protein